MTSGMSDFATTLRKQREAAGYTSARAFYRAWGPAFFGCTYKAYLNIESGRSVPQPRLAMKIAVGLQVSQDRGRAKGFVTAYLRALIGMEELTGFVVRILAGKAPPPGQSSLFQRAAERSMAGRTIPLSREKAAILLSAPEHYWAFTLLSDDFAHWKPGELAGRLELPEPRIRAALQDLVAARIFARDKEGRYYCPDAGKVFTFPRDRFYISRYREAMKGYWNHMSARQGATLLHRHIFTRASEANLRNYFPYLAQSVYGAHIYSTKEKSPDSALFLVEARVRRLLPF